MMIWGIFNFEKHHRTWGRHKWFAWRPVELRCGRWCWLQYIYRRRYSGYDCCNYFEYCLSKENLI